MNLRAAWRQFNEALAVRITAAVGTMNCAWLFAALAMVSLPGALATGDLVVIVGWTAQTFLQLVLLSILAVGQQVQGEALESHRVAQAAHHDRVERALKTHTARLDAMREHITATPAAPRTGRTRKEPAP